MTLWIILVVSLLLALSALWALGRLDIYWARLPAVAGALAGVCLGVTVMSGRRRALAALGEGLAGLAVMFVLAGAAYTALHMAEFGSTPPEIQPFIGWLSDSVEQLTRWVHSRITTLSGVRLAIPPAAYWR